MSHDSEELIANSPGQIPRGVTGPPAFKQATASLVFRRAFIGRVNKDVRIDDKHLTPLRGRNRQKRVAATSAHIANPDPSVRLSGGVGKLQKSQGNGFQDEPAELRNPQ
jgi:hypothetical protein